MWREARAPRVRLAANPHYWDTSRGPHLKEVVFRNDVPPAQALDLVCTTEGEFDIVTEVPPAAASRVEGSEYAKLVTTDPVRAVAGVIDREAEGLPLADPRARQALNHAVDRDRLMREALAGHGAPLAGLTPSCTVTWPLRLSPYRHDPRKAAELWRAAGGGAARPIRIAAFADWGPVARRVADDLREALGVGAEVTVLDREGELQARRRLAERAGPHGWDVLILMQGCQEAESVALELHRAFAGETGEYRAGPAVPAFEELYAELVRQTSPASQAAVTRRLDRLVYDEALALFLCTPHVLYAVNREVEFTPYRTTFELAECRVSKRHWSRR